MPTQNRRVATYLPKEIDDRLKAFIAERGLKGDSLALIVILSEYFGVSQQMAHKVDYSSFVTQEQFNELAAKVSELAAAIEKSSSQNSLLSRLPEKLKQLEERVEAIEETKSQLEHQEISTDESVPGQIDLLGWVPEEIQGELSSELPKNENSAPGDESQSPKSSSDSELKPMNGHTLSVRFRLHKAVVGNNKNNWKDNPDKFVAWTKKKDPSGVAWRYNPEDKLYHPITTEEEF